MCQVDVASVAAAGYNAPQAERDFMDDKREREGERKRKSKRKRVAWSKSHWKFQI